MSGLIPLVSGLIVKPIHSAELTQTLLELRYRWPHRWPGLAHVFKACLRRLGCDVDGQVSRSSDCSKAGTSQRFQVLLNSAMAIARLSEHQSRRQNEPSYHNRLHTADTLISMTALLSQTSSIGCSDSRDHNTCSRAFDADHFAFMLLVMLCHDVSHPGKINRFRFANELHSLRIVFPLLTREGLALRDQQRLRQLIIHTDPAICAANHQKTIAKPLSLDDKVLQQVLVNEADITASVLPEFAASQGQALANEWNDDFPDLAAGVRSLQGRLYFLEHTAMFSSPQALKLGLDTLRRNQVCELRGILGNAA